MGSDVIAGAALNYYNANHTHIVSEYSCKSLGESFLVPENRILFDLLSEQGSFSCPRTESRRENPFLVAKPRFPSRPLRLVSEFLPVPKPHSLSFLRFQVIAVPSPCLCDLSQS
jgi:hypothetical protein